MSNSGAKEDLSGKITKREDLSPVDRERMQRLSEEIDGRLEEIKLIMERTLGAKLGECSIKIRTHDIVKVAERAGLEVSRYDHAFCSHTNGCGAYIDPPGVCMMLDQLAGCRGEGRGIGPSTATASIALRGAAITTSVPPVFTDLGECDEK